MAILMIYVLPKVLVVTPELSLHQQQHFLIHRGLMALIKDYSKKGDGLGTLPNIDAIVRNPNLVHLPYADSECAAGKQVRDGLQHATYGDKDYKKP